MTDLHVQALVYEVESDPIDDYSRASPSVAEFEGFRCELKDGVMRAEPEAHFADPEDTRLDLEPHLRRWETEAEIAGQSLRFRYRGPEVIDRQPMSSDILTARAALL